MELNRIVKEIALTIGAFILLMVLIYFTFPWIFWGILNVLRIILLIILFILLLVMLLFLITMLMPLKYNLKVKVVDHIKNTKGVFMFSWFLKLIRGGFKFEDNKFEWYVKFLNRSYGGKEGFSNDVGNMDEFIAKKLSQSSEGKRETDDVSGKATETVDKDIEISKSITKESINTEVTNEKSANTENMNKESINKKGANVENINEAKEKSQTSSNERRNVFENENTTSSGREESKVIRKIKDFIKKIQYTYSKICDKIKMVVETRDKYVDAKGKFTEFINDEIHRKAFDRFVIEIKKLLRSLRPKEITGKCKFGFEDPKTTGTVLAGISLLYPYVGESSTFEADFDNQVLSGKLVVAGKIRAIYFLLFFIRLVIRKYVRITIKNIIKFQKEIKTSEGGF